jgi:Family of unknown function (DUF6263)
MKKLSFFLATAFMIMTLAGIESCKSASKTSTSKMLKFNLEQGKGYDYEMVWDLDTKVAGQESNISVTGLYSMNVTSIDENIRSVTTAYKSMRMNMKVGGMTIDIDSDKPVADNGETDISKNPLGMMNKVIGGMMGKKFVIKVNEEGKVLEVTGFEKIFADMIDSMGLDDKMKAQVSASFKDQFSEQTIKDQFAQVFTIFPNKEVKVGDSWEKTYSTGGKMAATYTTTYTAKEIEGEHVTLTTKTKIGSNGDSQDVNGTQSGNILVDSKTGLMISGEFDQDIEVKAAGQSVTVTGKGKIKGKAN